MIILSIPTIRFNARVKTSFRQLVFALLFLSVSMGAAHAFFWREKIAPSQKYLVAVMPFENNTRDATIDPLRKKASQIMLNELYHAGVFKLVEMERIGEILGEPLDDPYKDHKSYLQAIKSLGTELILMGNIHSLKYTENRKGLKEVTVSVGARLVNLVNGEIVYMGTASGFSRQKHKGQDKDTMYQVTDPLAEDAVAEAVEDLATRVARKARFKS